MNYNTWIRRLLFSFSLVEHFYLKRRVRGKEELREQILQKSRYLRRTIKDIERKERKMARIKRDLIPLIAKYRQM